MDGKIDRKIAIAAWPPDKAGRCCRSINRSCTAGCRMFALSLVQYPGIVFPRMDPLRCDRHPARRCRPLVFSAHQARGEAAAAARPGVSMLNGVFHLHHLAFVLQLIRKEMRCPKTTQMCRASVSAGLSALPSLQPP